jgi:hypothetical protein
MTDFTTFIQLGLRHIIDIGAMDHILFLLALAAIYRFSDWPEIIKVVTAFTVGHSITLAAAVLGYLPLSQAVVEFLIPMTIVATCIENILVKDRARAPLHRAYRPVFAILFGLVHGAGFGAYLKSLFVDSVAIPLLGFNVGIELGQIAVLAIVFTAIRAADLLLHSLAGKGRSQPAYRLRVVGISATIMIIASRWAFERTPW